MEKNVDWVESVWYNLGDEEAFIDFLSPFFYFEFYFIVIGGMLIPDGLDKNNV